MTITTPSLQQLAFFEELKSGTRGIILKAVAGSGKTTTIVHGAALIPPHVLSVFLAFNKRIVEELERRLPRHVQCGTFHSRGLRALSESLPKRPKIDGDKVRNLLKSNLKWSDFELYSKFCGRLISLAKSAGIGIPVLVPNELSAWEKLISHFSLTLDSSDADPERAIDIAMRCLEHSNDVLDVIDFDDMLYLALLRKVRFDKASFIFVDEAQDTNGVQRELLKLMLAPSGRLIAVGDPLQAIYGFRGADASAMDELASQFDCISLPLSTCYRCSKSVVAEVHNVLSNL